MFCCLLLLDPVVWHRLVSLIKSVGPKEFHMSSSLKQVLLAAAASKAAANVFCLTYLTFLTQIFAWSLFFENNSNQTLLLLLKDDQQMLTKIYYSV